MLARAASGDTSAAALAQDTVIAATFIDPDCIGDAAPGEPLADERLYAAVGEYVAWNLGSADEPTWIRFNAQWQEV
jgi:hypothetical protein